MAGRTARRARFESYLKEDLELASTPGTACLYSNVGMSLVGLVLSTTIGKRYETMPFAALAPCGGLYTSAGDFARFARARIDRSDPAIVLSSVTNVGDQGEAVRVLGRAPLKQVEPTTAGRASR